MFTGSSGSKTVFSTARTRSSSVASGGRVGAGATGGAGFSPITGRVKRLSSIVALRGTGCQPVPLPERTGWQPILRQPRRVLPQPLHHRSQAVPAADGQVLVQPQTAEEPLDVERQNVARPLPRVDVLQQPDQPAHQV